MHWKISQGTMEAVLLAARNTYPNEFFALLGGDKEKKEINEIVVVPAVYGKKHALVLSHLVPFDPKILGTVHSHPSRHGFPSKADLISFPKMGVMHLITSWPFNIASTKCFDLKGKKIELEIIEEE